MNASKMPMALLPPPTQATMASGQPADLIETLAARLLADDGLELANHERIRVRPEDGSEQVVAVGDVGDPVAHRLVDGVLQRARAGVDAPHGRAEQLHPEDVQRLALHVVGAHVDVAVEPQERTDRRRRDAVLPGAGLGNHAPLPHPLCQQRLPERVVDLVGPRVREVLALEEDARAAERLGEPPGFVQRRRASDVVPQQLAERGAEGLVRASREVRALELVDRGDERLGNEPSAVRAVVAARVGITMAE